MTRDEAMSSILGGFALPIRSVFALMSVAEECITQAGLEGDRAIFGELLPPEGMSEAAEWIYRAHCVEFCKTRRLGTNAEVLLALHVGSQKHPLEQGHSAAMVTVFKRCCELSDTTHPSCDFLDWKIAEPWEGRVDEIIDALSSKIRIRKRQT